MPTEALEMELERPTPFGAELVVILCAWLFFSSIGPINGTLLSNQSRPLITDSALVRLACTARLSHSASVVVVDLSAGFVVRFAVVDSS